MMLLAFVLVCITEGFISVHAGNIFSIYVYKKNILRNILPTAIKDICKYILGPDLLSFNGSCRDVNNDYYVFDVGNTNSPNDCEIQCRNKKECTAFSYRLSDGYCQFYGRGPYTHGEGSLLWKCYVMPGKFTCY